MSRVASQNNVEMELETAVQPQLARLERSLQQVVRSPGGAVRMALIAFLAQGHLLIEDVPGVGKTTLAQALAHLLDGRFQRVQFTSDLLPSDVIGVSIFNQAQERFEFHQGPVFSNVLLADEINRTTPKTQSALLEAMNERQVTVDNRTYALPDPFWVIATQNPSEHHGTYPLPESQLDRFLLRIRMGYPSPEDERAILRGEAGASRIQGLEPVLSLPEMLELQRQTQAVRVADAVMDYELALAEASRKHPGLELGISPRGVLMLHRAAQAQAMLEGRGFCVPHDIKRLFLPVCAHRVVSQALLGGRRTEVAETLLREILDATPVPE